MGTPNLREHCHRSASIRTLVGALLGIMVALHHQQVAAIEGGTEVPAEQILQTGAVMIGGCSGMLVTPWWALTAAHCEYNKRIRCMPAPKMIVSYGNTRDFTAPTARIVGKSIHPGYNCNKPRTSKYDVMLVRLDEAIFPERMDGSLWENYRRGIYFGDVLELADRPVNIYGYGFTHDDDETYDSSGNLIPGGLPDDSGILRWARMKIESVNDFALNIDGYHGEQLWPGDSGAAILIPGYGFPAQRDDYWIAGVNSLGGDRLLGDTENDGSHAASFREWFYSTIGTEWSAYNVPSHIMAALTPVW